MSLQTRQSSPRRSHRSWPTAQLTVRSCGPVWGRQSVPRCWPCVALCATHARNRRLLPSPPCSPDACEARQPACGALAQWLGRSAAMPTGECTRPPCPWRHRCPRQRDRFVPSSTPFLARYGLEALATVRVEEDTGAVPRSDTGLSLLGVTGSVPATGGFARTARSHILPDFLDTRGVSRSSRTLRKGCG